MSNIINLGTEWFGKVNPDGVLRGAVGELSEVIVIGKTKEGNLYVAMSEPELHKQAFLLDLAKYEVIKQAIGDE